MNRYVSLNASRDTRGFIVADLKGHCCHDHPDDLARFKGTRMNNAISEPLIGYVRF